MLDIALGGMNRRDFVRVGALGAVGLALPGLLRSEAQAARAPARKKSILLLYLGGGLAHHDSFDLKPDAPEEIAGKYKPIASSVTGLKVGELLPRTAKIMNRVALVRSGAHNNDHHETATNWVLSGRFGSAFGDYPAIGAVVAHETGFRAQVPPYVSIPNNPSFTWELGRSAFLGGRYESFKAGDPNSGGYKVRDLSRSQQLSEASLNRRKNLLQAVDSLG